MTIEIKEEELTKLKNKVTNPRQQVRTFNKSQIAAKEKAEFSDTDKLLLQVSGTEAMEPITKRVLASFSDNDFWRKHRHDNIENILIALAKKAMN